MTQLEVRRIDFDFEDEVPFVWNPRNPAFSLQMNAVSVIAVAFEKYIVRATRKAQPLIEDPAVAEEAEAFLKQEAQHSRAHRQHLHALVRQYPGLQQTITDAVASYDELFDTKPLAHHLAYVADLEATFTPTFKLFLDHEDKLFRPGDDRVASLFLWHFVEEVEHRSSALVIFDHVVGRPWYRMRQLPSVLWHLKGLLELIADGFNAHVPLADRRVDARILVPVLGPRGRAELKRVNRAAAVPDVMPGVPVSDQRTAALGVVRSQTPYHDPGDQPLPAFADRWLRRYGQGEDLSRFYAATGGARA